jgi:hypothetical protein
MAVKPGPIVSPRHCDRDSHACGLRTNPFDITTLANAPYHCGFDKGLDTLMLAILTAIEYNNTGSEDVIACHNNIIDTHRRVLQLWHNPTANMFGTQVNRILQKSFKLFPVLESTLTKDTVKFYDQLQEKASDHILALMPFDAIMLRIGFEGLCIPGLGVHRYMRMGKALMDLLPKLIPGSLSPQINAALASVHYESKNGYDYLWCVLEVIVPGFDPVVPIQIPIWADYEFWFAQALSWEYRRHVGDMSATCRRHVGNMSATCQRHVKMWMNLGIFACGCQHQNSPDTRFLCQKLPTLYPAHTTSQKCRTLHFGVCRSLKIYSLK